MLLSAFQVTNRQQFLRLRREDRHHIAASIMQHTGAMRFGQFGERDYSISSFITDATASKRLVTDWSRYASQRQFSIEFSSNPQFASMWYKVYAPNGDLLEPYPAATLLQWHFDELRAAGETRVLL